MVKNPIKVYARLKPEKNRKNISHYRVHRRPKENLEQDLLVLVAPTQKTKDYPDNRPESWNFSFFQIFEESTTQEDVFENVARPVVESALDGYNGTIFAYGQTASGKTHSITGEQGNRKDRGIVPRSLQYLFDVIRKRPENVYSVEVAYLEIYNEYGYDLLDRRQQREVAITRLEDLPRVSIQEDEFGRLHVKNLTFHSVKTVEEAFELLLVGDNNRVISETPMNPQSSRSHCIFTIVVSTKQFGMDQYKRAKVHLVDLAGSERVYKCSISGTILTEAKHINLSLHYLEQVIVCLGQESTGHIPYRNCLLTSMLRDSLGGNCLTTMLATVSVASRNLEETVSTCRFAQRVALIRNDVREVFEEDIQSENALLRLENERLKQQIKSMTRQITSGELTADDRRNLDTQINSFLEADRVISWDYDPQKVQYCFESFKRIFESNRDPNSCAKKLEHYKDMVIQRDKEISLLIDMMKKERGKKNQSLSARPTNNNKEDDLKPAEKSKNSNRDEIQSVEIKWKTEINQINGPLAARSGENAIFQQNVAENEETAANVVNDKEIFACNFLKKQTRGYRSSKLDAAANSEGELPNKSISADTLKPNLLSCNIVNLTLNDVADCKDQVPDRIGNNKFEESNKPSVHKSERKTRNKMKPESDRSGIVKNNRTEVEETKISSEETDYTTPFYQRFLNFNVPEKEIKSERMQSPVKGPNRLQSSRGNNYIFHNEMDSSRNQNIKKEKSDTRFTVDFPEKACAIDKNVTVETVDSEQLNHCNNNNKDFYDSLPLTGDPEIDEEIVAFYKAKRSGGVY